MSIKHEADADFQGLARVRGLLPPLLDGDAITREFLNDRLWDYTLLPGNTSGGFSFGGPEWNPAGSPIASGPSTPSAGGTFLESTHSYFALTNSDTDRALSVVWMHNGNSGLLTRGESAGRGGFVFRTAFAFVDQGATAPDVFAGLQEGGEGEHWSDTEDISALINLVGMGYRAADTHYQIIHNDGSGAPTFVDLGASFPKGATIFRLTLISASHGSGVDYIVENVETGASVDGTLTTNIPADTVYLNGKLALVNGGGGLMQYNLIKMQARILDLAHTL